LKLSVVIPAHNEAGSIAQTVRGVTAALRRAAIDYAVLVIDDSSTDGTKRTVEAPAAGFTPTSLASYLAQFPPTEATTIRAGTSWSCAHGVERGRSDCGCNSGMRPGWGQHWRKPLRDSLAAAGIAYEHLPGLGGRREPPPDSPHPPPRLDAFRGYADHMSSEEFQRDLAVLVERASAALGFLYVGLTYASAYALQLEPDGPQLLEHALRTLEAAHRDVAVGIGAERERQLAKEIKDRISLQRPASEE